MRVQYDLTIDLADTEIAEPSGAMDLAGDGESAVVSAHDLFDLWQVIETQDEQRLDPGSVRLAGNTS